MTVKPDIVFGLYGIGGFGREVMPLAREVLQHRFGAGLVEAVFVETYAPPMPMVNGFRVLAEDAFFALEAKQKYFNIAVADFASRETLAKKCHDRGLIPLTLQAPTAIIYDNNDIGEGAILCANTVITSNARIGKFFHANIYSYVAHDCIVGDYVTFAPRVSCNGCVHVGNHVYIGTNATLRQGGKATPLTIGEGATIGMGAVVTKDVPPHTTVVGNPARPLQKS
jgi:sugar O-acyltransferase (sialic acid O-acetyltransferase NeuD family)